MARTTDPLRDVEARVLAAALADRGITLRVVRGRLQVAPASRLTDADDQAIRAHRDALLVLALVCHDRTLDRLRELWCGRLSVRQDVEPGHCYLCADPLPVDRAIGRCGWCAVAVRVYAGAPIPRDVLRLFDAGIRGTVADAGPAPVDLPYDEAVPA